MKLTKIILSLLMSLALVTPIYAEEAEDSTPNEPLDEVQEVVETTEDLLEETTTVEAPVVEESTPDASPVEEAPQTEEAPKKSKENYDANKMQSEYYWQLIDVDFGASKELVANFTLDEGEEVSYQWYVQRVENVWDFSELTPIDGATSSTYVVESVQEMAIYYCYATNTDGNQDSTIFNVIVKDDHSYWIENVTVPQGTSATLSLHIVDGEGNIPASLDGYHFRWYKFIQEGTEENDWELIDGATGTTLTIDSVTEPAKYLLEISTPYKEITTRPANVLIDHGLAVPQDCVDVHINAGETATLDPQATVNDGDLHYSWTKHNELTDEYVQLSTSNTLEVTLGGSYIVNISDDYGNTESVYFHVEVSNGFDWSYVASVKLQPGESVVLDPQATVTQGDLQYIWKTDDGELISTASTCEVSEIGTYWCTMVDEFENDYCVVFTVSLDNELKVPADSIYKISNGEPVTLDATSTVANGSISYRWVKYVYNPDADKTEVVELGDSSSYQTSVPGMYVCHISDEYGNQDRTRFTVWHETKLVARYGKINATSFDLDGSPNVTVNYGEDVTLSVETSDADVEIKWYKTSDRWTVGTLVSSGSNTCTYENVTSNFMTRVYVADNYGDYDVRYINVVVENHLNVTIQSLDSYRVVRTSDNDQTVIVPYGENVRLQTSFSADDTTELTVTREVSMGAQETEVATIANGDVYEVENVTANGSVVVLAEDKYGTTAAQFITIMVDNGVYEPVETVVKVNNIVGDSIVLDGALPWNDSENLRYNWFYVVYSLNEQGDIENYYQITAQNRTATLTVDKNAYQPITTQGGEQFYQGFLCYNVDKYGNIMRKVFRLDFSEADEDNSVVEGTFKKTEWIWDEDSQDDVKVETDTIGTWSFDTNSGLLTITRTSEDDSGDMTTPWEVYKDQVVSLALNNIKYIPSEQFKDYSALKTVTAKGTKDVYENAFDNCAALISASFDSAISYMCSNSFAGCGALTSVTLDTCAELVELDGYYNEETDEDVPFDGFLGTQATTTFTKNLSDMSFTGSCGTNVTYSFDGATKTLTISGTGAMKDFSDNNDEITNDGEQGGFSGGSEASFGNLSKVTEHLVVEEGVTAIGSGSFSRFTKLADVTLPSTLTKIGDDAFRYAGMAHISIPATVTSLGNSCFKGSGLVDFTLPTTVNEVGTSLLANCASLTTVTLPSGMPRVWAGMFDGCSALAQLSIPSTVTKIGPRAFAGTGLTEITIPSGVTTIYGRAFECSSLTSISLPASVTKIYLNTFMDSESLTNIAFGNTRENIEIVPKREVDWDDDDNEIVTEITFETNNNKFDGTEAEVLFGQVSQTVVDGTFEKREFTRNPETGVTELLPAGEIGVWSFNPQTGKLTVEQTIPGYLRGITTPWDEYKNQIKTIEFINLTNFGGSAIRDYNALETLTIRGTKEINSYAFLRCTALTSVFIDETIESIEADAFDGCSALTTVSIDTASELVTLRGEWNDDTGVYDPFTGFTGTQATATFTKQLSEVVMSGSCGENATYTFTGATRTLTISGTGATQPCDYEYEDHIKDNGFEDGGGQLFTPEQFDRFRTLIQHAVVENGITEISYALFANCTNMVDVVLPNSLKTIAANAFYNTGLTSVTIPASVTKLGNSCFRYSKLASFTLPSTVTDVGINILSGCAELTSVTLPSDMTSIPAGMFQNCAKLANISVPSTVNYIGPQAFAGTTALKQISIPNGVSTIYGRTFANTGLESLELPESVTKVYMNSFEGSQQLSTITFGALRDDVTIDPTAQIVWGQVSYLEFEDNNDKFYDCNATVSFKVDDTILKGNLTAYEVGTVGKWTLNKNTGELLLEKTNGLTYSRLVTEQAWLDNKDIITKLTVDGLSTITDSMFKGFTALETLEIGDVEYIGANAFEGCTSLSATLTLKTLYVESNAFKDCTSLKKVVFTERMIEMVDTNAFAGCTNLTRVEVDQAQELMNMVIEGGGTPDGLEEIILVGPRLVLNNENVQIVYTKQLRDVVLTGNLSDDVIWTYTGANNTLTISGNGYAPGWADSVSVNYLNGEFVGFNYTNKENADIWRYIQHVVEHVVVEEGVTGIGYNLFARLTNVKTASLPSTLTEIGSGAFTGCVSLETLELPSGLKVLGTAALAHTKIRSVVIPSTIEEVGEYVFYRCASLESVNLPIRVITISNGLFMGCTSLSSVTFTDMSNNFTNNKATAQVDLIIPDTVVSIGSNAFDGCKSFTSISIGKGVSDIGVGAFAGCSSVETITVSAENEKYDSREESNAIIDKETNVLTTGCQNTVIPETVEGLGAKAFAGCDNLTEIVIPESVTAIEDKAFSGCDSLETVIFTGTKTELDDINMGEGNESLFGDSGEKVVVEYKVCTQDGHLFVDGTEQVANPTCTEAGYRTQFCERCSYDVKVEVLDALGHNLAHFEALAPTPDETGHIEYWHCDRCDKYFTEIEDYTETTYDELWLDVVPYVGFVTLPENNTVYYLKTYQLAVELKNLEGEVTYSSSNTSIATVSTTGLITAKKIGTTTITAKVGEYENSFDLTVAFEPATITAVKNASSTSMKITWSKVNKATGYYVYRSTSENGTYSKVATITKGSTVSYTNTKLKAGTTYYYKIKAYTTISGKKYISGYGNIMGSVILGKPSVTVAKVDYQSLKVSWKAIKGATSYELYRSTSEKGTYTLVDTLSTTSYTDADVFTGTTYWYKVKATTLVSARTVSSSTSSAASGKATMSTPTLTASKNDYKSIKLNWNVIAGAEGYEIYRATSSSGTYSLVGTVEDGATQEFVQETATNKTYYYKVRAYRTANEKKVYSSYSSYKSATATLDKPTLALSSVMDGIQVTATVDGADGYELYRATSKSGTYSKVKTFTDLDTEVYSITSTKTYYYKLRAYRMVGTSKAYSSYSSIVSYAYKKPADTRIKVAVLSVASMDDAQEYVNSIMNDATLNTKVNVKVVKFQNGDDIVDILNKGGYDVAINYNVWTWISANSYDGYTGKLISLSDTTEEVAQNQYLISTRTEDYGYVAGAIAGAVSAQYAGAIIGMDFKAMNKFLVGYVELLASMDKSYCLSYPFSFADAALGKEVANIMLSKGVDIIYGAAGSLYNGAIDAVADARSEGKRAFAIGIDQDQYVQFAESNPEWANAILTSVMFDIGQGLKNVVSMVANEELTSKLGTKEALGYKEGFITYVKNENFLSNTTEAQRALIEEKLANLKNGTFVITDLDSIDYDNEWPTIRDSKLIIE